MTVVALLAGCSAQEEDLNYGKGGLLISLGNEEVEVSMRATPAELGVPEPVFFHLSATKDDTGDVIYNGDFKTRIVSALPGNYTLQATCGEDVILGWDTPYYIGTAQAEVLNGQTTEITIPCKVGNSLVSVRYANPELFDQLYSDYALKVFVEPYSISIDAAQAERSAYLRAGSDVQISFVATTLEGTEVDYSLNKSLEAYLPLQAADHAIITLSASNFGVNVSKVEVKQVTVQETIPMEWLPKPKLANFGNGTNALETVETNDAIAASIGYTAAMPIEDFEFTLNFEDPQYTGLNKTYTLSTLSDADRTALTGIGIVLPTLNTQSGSLDLTNLTGNLQTNKGTTTNNKINVRVKANNRWSNDTGQDYTIKVIKPEFTINMWPGNIWTKEMNAAELTNDNITKGNLNRIKSKITYQYQTSGGSWTNFNDGARVSGLQTGTSYNVRGVYREGIYSTTANVSTFSPITLTNGSLNDYTYEGNDGKIFQNYGRRFFWNGWATLNELTCDYCIATAYAYNTRSGTRPVTDAVNGNAAWIATIGWGYGSTTGSTKIHTPGELYLGTLTNVNHDDDTANKNYGISYASHPTSLAFHYKYIPYDSDKSDIYIQVLHDNTILGSATLQQASTVNTYTYTQLSINYLQEAEKLKLAPNKLIVVFKSGFNSSVKNYGSSGLNSVRHVGSQLFIDEVSLVYDK